MKTFVIMTFQKPFHGGFFIYRLRYLFLIFFLYFLSFGLIGLLFNLHWGMMGGLTLATLIFAFLLFFGEKIILIFARARYVTDDEILINQVKNFCCHCEIPEVKVYWSSVFVNNVYFTNTYFGKPALIIGKNLYNTFTRTELNSLIYASLLKLKKNEAKHRTMASLIFFIIYSPVYFIRSLTKKEQIIKILDVFLYPAFFLKAQLYEKPEHILGFDQEVLRFEGLRKDYISALFKISLLPAVKESSIGGFLVSELSHAKNKTNEVLSSILIDYVSVETRVKALK